MTDIVARFKTESPARHWKVTWKRDGKLVESDVESFDRDTRGLAIRVAESLVPLHEFQIRSVGQYINGRLIAGWDAWRFGIDGCQNVDIDPAPSMSLTAGCQPTVKEPITRKFFAELTEDEKHKFQTAFGLSDEVFESLARGLPINLPGCDEKTKGDDDNPAFTEYAQSTMYDD